MKSSLNGRTSTALTPSNVNVVGGGACFNDARVEVAASLRRLTSTRHPVLDHGLGAGERLIFRLRCC
jgi:hypothetical protein